MWKQKKKKVNKWIRNSEERWFAIYICMYACKSVEERADPI